MQIKSNNIITLLSAFCFTIVLMFPTNVMANDITQLISSDSEINNINLSTDTNNICYRH